jgi:ElaB/YqjD/DUF883 family membrane-anchored ribosome-binding protein
MSTSETDTRGDLQQESRRYAAQEALQDQDTDVIEQEIDATRADMRATLEALERRFSFDRLVDLTVGRIRERGGEFAGNLTDAATQNPVPLLLTSIGLGWMMLTSRRGTRTDDDYSAGPASGLREHGSKLRQRMSGMRARAGDTADKIHGAVDSTRDTLRSAADSTREAWRSATQSSRETIEHTSASLHDTAESLRDTASRAAATTREQVEHARERMDRLLHEQPLMLGALGLAAGAIIGALLPSTEQEGRALGEMRQKAIDEVAQKGRARYETAKETVKQTVKQAVGINPAPAADTGDEASRGQASRPH